MDSIEPLIYREPIPRMLPVAQHFSRIRLENPQQSIRRELSRAEICSTIRPGMTVAITAGSREIDNNVLLLREIVSFVKSCGGHPFLIPAMGSHGGATAEGQEAFLRVYGIQENTVGAPIRSSMEVVQIATLDDGRPVYIDRFAAEADGIILFNRVKPHTAFHDIYESGLMKMMAIGLGKQYGASVVHREGSYQMGRNVRLFGEAILHHANILFGVATVENCFHQTLSLAALTREEIPQREPELLALAKQNIPQILLEGLDVLVVGSIGKNISGTGMDPNVTHAYAPETRIPPDRRAQRIVVLRLTEETHGCANGIGLADVTTRQVAERYDARSTYANAITARSSTVAKLPMWMDNDKLAIQAAIALTYGVDKERLRMVYIENTLRLSRILISESMLEEARQHPQIEILGAPATLNFTTDNQLKVML